VSGRLGHSKPPTTLSVYAHFVEIRDQVVAAVMGELLSTRDAEAGEAVGRRNCLLREITVTDNSDECPSQITGPSDTASTTTTFSSIVRALP
jgi:hypothetical protein